MGHVKDHIRINDPEDGKRIMALAGGGVFNPLAETVIARVVDGAFVGGAAYGNFTGRSCEMHTAGVRPRWVSRDLLWTCFDYPFTQLGVEKVFGRVQASNEAALKFDFNLGFREEARLKDVYPDGDLVILSMYRQDCRWLNLRPRGYLPNTRGD